MICTNDLPLNVCISGLEFLKPHEKRILRNNLDNIKELALLSISDISNIVHRAIKTSLWHPDEIEKQTAYRLKLLEAYDIKVCTMEDNDYPALLKEIFDPPFMLFWRGNIECALKKSIAIVGTRHASAMGLKTTFEVAKKIAEKGINVVSGLALGIDGAAHKGALAARIADTNRNGSTCAVIACGVDSLYPASHSKLGGSIIEKGGCVLSEYPPASLPQKWCFPARNRIISGLSSVTAVIEAPAGSGALITADFAIEQGRELAFHAYGVNQKYKEPVDSKKMNINRYVHDGAPIVKNADELIEMLNSSQTVKEKQTEFDFDNVSG